MKCNCKLEKLEKAQAKRDRFAKQAEYYINRSVCGTTIVFGEDNELDSFEDADVANIIGLESPSVRVKNITIVLRYKGNYHDQRYFFGLTGYETISYNNLSYRVVFESQSEEISREEALAVLTNLLMEGIFIKS